MDTSTPFKWRHFQADIILLCVHWYLRYSLSYRDLEEIMLERCLHIDHTTIYRWGKVVEDRLHEDTYKLINELQERLSQVDQV